MVIRLNHIFINRTQAEEVWRHITVSYRIVCCSEFTSILMNTNETEWHWSEIHSKALKAAGSGRRAKTIAKVRWLGMYGIYDARKSAFRWICNNDRIFSCLPSPTTPTLGDDNISCWQRYASFLGDHFKIFFMIEWYHEIMNKVVTHTTK